LRRICFNPPLIRCPEAARVPDRVSRDRGYKYSRNHEPSYCRAAAALRLGEIWSSTKLKLPVLTKTIGAFSGRICKPPSSVFEILSGYKILEQR
jgi:hypothetical protein